MQYALEPMVARNQGRRLNGVAAAVCREQACRWGAAVLAAAIAALLASGCGGDGSTSNQGTNDQSVPATVSNAVVSVPVSIDGVATMPFLVDTGAVLPRLDPSRFPTLMLTPGLGQVSTLDVGSIHLTNVQVVAASLCGAAMMMCPASEASGLLGGAVMGGFAVTVDYQGHAVTFGAFTPPASAQAPVMVSFDLEGGGDATIGDVDVTLPATRIAVDVNVEGTVVPMLVDTGSSTMVIEPALYDTIVADGRAQSTASVATVMGTESVPSTKLHAVSLAGATQAEVTAVRSPLDMELLSNEVGHPVRGLVGGAYLENYLTTIDYPARQITLRPY